MSVKGISGFVVAAVVCGVVVLGMVGSVVRRRQGQGVASTLQGGSGREGGQFGH